MSTQTITEFWTWFDTNSKGFETDSVDTHLLEMLDKKVGGFDLTWEVGPGKVKEYSFTLSPSCRQSHVGLTKSIIEKAPALHNWEFYSFKQRKTNWNICQLQNTDKTIDASNWTYVLLSYPTGDFDILLKADSILTLDSATKELAADLVLTNLLGEEEMIAKIAAVELVINFDDNHLATRLTHLPDHLNSLTS